jgi:anti-sigma B factor antagonist
MTELLHVDSSFEGSSACLVLSGELTYGTVPVFEEHVAQVLGAYAGRSGPRLVVDVHGLQFCDSVGLSALIGAQRRTEQGEGRMVLRGVHGMLERVLRITGAGVLFTVVGGDLVDRADRAAVRETDRAGELA